MKFLTSSTLSGLGRHIHQTFGGAAWNRQIEDAERKELKRQGADVIVHCAFNSSRAVDSNNLHAYVADNVALTQELVSVPHRKFVYLSSVDVYPKELSNCSEGDAIDIDAVDSIYGVVKLMSESIVKENCPDYLILRCVTLLGRYSRKNSLSRIFEDDPHKLSLASNSQFNYVLHSDVSDLIRLAVDRGIGGVFNVASSQNIDLASVAAMLGKQVEYGAYRYDVGRIDNSKIASISPVFNKSSRDSICQYAEMRAGRE